MGVKFPASYDNRNDLLVASKVTMVVNSCDDYQDVWPLFFSSLNDYWPKRKFDVVINTESQTFVFGEKNQKISWGERLLITLEKLNTEYVILVFDDYLLESYVDTVEVNKRIYFLDNNSDAAVFYLNAVCLNSHREDVNSDYRVLKNKVEYRLNSAPAIWRRVDLISYVGKNDTPWAWEVFGSYRTFDDGKGFYSQSSVKNNLFIYNYKKGGAIYRGKWVAEVVVPKNIKYNLNIDFNERGFSNCKKFEKRSVRWKVAFIWLGFRMIGYKVVYFIMRSIRTKMYAKK